MKKKLYFIVIIVSFTLLMAGCQEFRDAVGNETTSGVDIDISINIDSGTGSRDEDFVHEILYFDPFDRIEIYGVFDVIYRQSDEHRVELHIQPWVLEVTEISVSDRQLQVSQPPRLSFQNEPTPRIYIYAPTLTDISLDGVIMASGWSEIHVDQLTLDIDGVTTVEIKGSATTALINVDGVTTMNGLNLETQSMVLDVNGVSDVSVSVSDDFDIFIRGVNTVRYRGNPVINERYLDFTSTLREVN